MALDAILPEPKDVGESSFVQNLNPGKVFLGMTDTATEGTWVWGSDGSRVLWTNWLSAQGEPDGGVKQNCAIMMRSKYAGQEGHKDEGWLSKDCSNKPKNIICQKKGGFEMCVFIS